MPTHPAPATARAAARAHRARARVRTARAAGLPHRTRTALAGPGRREGGQSAVEYVGWITVLLFVALAAIQLGIVAYAVQQAGTASRAAARVASQGGDGGAAGRSAVSGWLADDADISAVADGERARGSASIRIPSLLPVLDFGTAHRTTTMPVTTSAD
ncbi:TadE/TadG family type IV pilus assembly protein [Streptomyces sp. NPDC047928]|uniref:TadE/TadG family type IV pilus assembly protein n=1 Tax=unclassified Streptomyces TaxID=2593676 RepID=UPI003710FFD7